MRAQSPQLCWTLCDPMDCSPLCSSVHEILQERILEWVAMPSPGFFPNASPSQTHLLPEHVSCVSCIVGRFYTHRATWEAHGRLQYLAEVLSSCPATILGDFTVHRKVPWLIFHPVSWSPVTSPITGFQPFICKVRLLTTPPPNH